MLRLIARLSLTWSILDYDSILEKSGTIPKSRRLTVVFELPPSAKAGETLPIVEVALNLIDVLSGSSMPNELLKKTVSIAPFYPVACLMTDADTIFYIRSLNLQRLRQREEQKSTRFYYKNHAKKQKIKQRQKRELSR